ncbi:tRNA 2-selenouridine(34) synthase MnmH [Xinfangfangia pollutisoli]|uniref:tRNA 2-selenouridine(34) synthase MnmH n=1 Tax=Xinfangfangia pollutisoli TaxID=2865960 RepID=UPI001CD386CC|nr:tRNA 2-selenouridine(34) synthase MnmH [Xinfangfangia pollutisoli]
MALTLTALTQIARAGFDDVIDARSPAEYAEDHLPGAINLPVLDDAERARVGTVYTQVSPFIARKIGAALVARNAALHLEGPLLHKPGGWRPLLYCWRGGQRSGSFATILSQIGWRVETIAGGYKAWRGLVVQALYDQPPPAPLWLLDGNTGSAKTEILARLSARGVQVLDLEALAGHRGSVFGAMGPQPSQRAFEGRLAMALATLDPSRPVVVEAESAKIGACRLPTMLWKAMCAAPRIVLQVPAPARAAYLARAYADLAADGDRLAQIIGQLRPHHPRAVIEDWLGLAARADVQPLALALMQRHYDPRYARHRARLQVPVTELAAPRLDDTGIETLAAQIATTIAAENSAARARP